MGGKWLGRCHKPDLLTDDRYMRNMNFRQSPSAFALLLIIAVFPLTAFAENEPPLDNNQPGVFELIEPLEQSTVVGKQPAVRFRFLETDRIEGYVAILDGADITAVVQQDQYDFIYRPIRTLPSGEHTLMVIAYYSGGTQAEEQKMFQSRHLEKFEEAYSENEIGAVYSPVLYRKGHYEDAPNYQVTGNLHTSSKLKESGFEATGDANFWYLEQNQPVPDPQKPGVDLADYLVTASYTKDQMKAYTEIGDVSFDLTPYTIQGLSRRGGAVGLEYGDYYLRVMNTSSEELFGFNGGLGFSDSSDDSLTAFSGGVDLFSGQLSIKAAYLTGGIETESYNSWTADAAQQKGDAAGLLVQSNLFDNRLQLEAEVGYSGYDFDISDEFSEAHGYAYRFAASGYYEQFTYGASYQYISPEYEVIASTGTQNDKEEIAVNGGVTFDSDTVQVNFVRYHDNVDNDDLYPRITNTDGSIDYTIGRFGDITATLGYMRNLQKSSHEPDTLVEVDTSTDTFSGSLGYFKESFSADLSGSYSEQNDKTDTNLDSSILSFGLTPSYYSDWVSVGGSLNWTRISDDSTDVDTDTFTVGLNLNGDIVKDRLSYDLAGTYTTNEANDDSTDMYSFDATAKLTYSIVDEFYGFVNPSVGLEGRYFYSHDNVSKTKEDDRMIMLVFSTSYLFGF